MNEKRRILSAFILLLFCCNLPAQDIHFSQFYMAPLTQNPGLAGAMHNAEANIIYKSQWGNITNPYKTYAASGMTKLGKGRRDKGFFAGGLNFFNDQSGDGKLSITTGALTLAYHIPLSKYHKLGLGLQAGFGHGKINFQDLQWGSQYTSGAYSQAMDPGENTSNPTFNYFDFGSGIVWSFNNTSGSVKTSGGEFNRGSFGFSVFHINQPVYSFINSEDRLKMKYVIHGNYLFTINSSKVALFPGFMYYQQGPANELLFGSMVRYKLSPKSKYSGFYKGAGAYLGAYVRTRDAIVISSLVEFSQFAVGISYDVNTSTLRSASNGRGGLEFCLRVTGGGLSGKK